MIRVGLTGGIASGKTTVARMLEERGCHVLFADQIAHDLMAPGRPAHGEIVEAFGRQVLTAEGAIDRGRLGAIVFADRSRLERLNAILHPRVVVESERELDQWGKDNPRGLAVVEAALLIEVGYHTRFDKLIVTWCRPEQQLERLVQKTGLSEEKAKERLAAQMPPEQKRRLADYEIDCSGSLEATEAQVERVYQELRSLAARQSVS